MKQTIPKNNFSSGIISQQLSGRIDLSAFSNGLKNIENFDINLNGSISKRTGFEIVGYNDIEGESYFMKFVFNQEQVYLLEFKEMVFRVWITTEDNKVQLYKEKGISLEEAGSGGVHYFSSENQENEDSTEIYKTKYFFHILFLGIKDTNLTPLNFQ